MKSSSCYRLSSSGSPASLARSTLPYDNPSCCLDRLRRPVSKPALQFAVKGTSATRTHVHCRVVTDVPQLAEGDLLSSTAATKRRSANYQPASWDNNFLQSLTCNEFTEEKYGEHHQKLIDDVKIMFSDAMAMADPLCRLELVDTVQRLGLKRHFMAEIETAMDVVNKEQAAGDLYVTSLRFRLLRQHGYDASEDVFKKFRDDSGNFDVNTAKDVKGLLSLYEASYFEWEGDQMLGHARTFTIQHLNNLLTTTAPAKLAYKVKTALTLPLNWRPPRLEARWSIEAYENEVLEYVNSSSSTTLLQLAKLDFNLSQSVYKEEIRRSAKRWMNLNVATKLPFVRDRLLEHYCWSYMAVDDPKQDHVREAICQIGYLISAMDDTYDIYGTVEELEVLTDMINRWDIRRIDELPEPMKLCFLAIYNASNEIGYQILNDRGFNCIPYLHKMWASLSNYYMREAKWYNEGYKPSLKDYLKNYSVSVGCHVFLFVSYLFTTTNISKEGADYLDEFPTIMNCCSLIFRLNNDLATSSAEFARGDSMKSLHCYVNDTGATEQAAREYIDALVQETWKKMNKEYYLKSSARGRRQANNLGCFPSASFNLAQATQFFFQFKRDGLGNPDSSMKNHIRNLLIDPLPLDLNF